ncbi:PcfJ domain-containing protein [Fibrobacter sp.]|uniref:PcfJ domain-containing protein n=1 Tax=Fibrobacter sp. TaxID=35828 RepID=UPI0025C235B0|nr:PcfJ domain-containing protein [Fibrobacter sp.]MBR3073616.1 PcfJ domain-containing protein [Fibrobacter sp.]
MHKFTDRLTTVRGIPAYEILGCTKEHKDPFVVYREYMTGYKSCRNLYRSIYNHYETFGTPEHFYKYACKETPNIVFEVAKPDELEPIFKLYPDFKYIRKKMENFFRKDTFKILEHWKQHPEMELLLNFNLPNLAMNKTFFKMKKDRQKEIVKFTLQHGEKRCYFMLPDILGAMKYNCNPSDYREYRLHTKKSITYPEYLALKANEVNLYDFSLYKDRLKRYFPERLKDPYWTQPKNQSTFLRREKKVLKEIKAIEELRDIEKAKAKAEAYINAIKKVKGWSGIFNGLCVYVPTDIEDWKNQADALKQCLVKNDYIQKVIDKKSLVVFIKKKDKPIATAEFVGKEMKLTQFYGNEEKRNIKPPKSARIALDMFTDKFIRKCA